MAGVIKYSTTTPTNQSTLRKGNTVIAVGNDATSQFRANGFSSGVDIPLGGYVVYTIGLNNNPKVWVANNKRDLTPIARTLGFNPATPATAADAKYYICSVTDAWILDNPINNIVTDGLVLKLDAGNLSSYPEINTSFMDLSGEGNDGTLINGPTFNSNEWIDFDGVNDYATIPNTNLVPSNVTSLTVGGLWKRNGDGSSYETILHQSSNTSIGNSAYWFGWTNDNIVCCTIGARNGVGWAAGKTNIPATVGKWFYTVASWNGSTVSVWVNGILKVTYNLSTYTNPGTVTRLGASGNASGYLANGSIANIHINPNKAFTESEMLTNYYQAPIVTDGLVFAVDAGNLVSYENGDTTTYSLTGSLSGLLNNGVDFGFYDGGYWEFDGVDDYIDFGSINSSNPMSFFGVNNMTLEIWVYPIPSGDPYQRVIDKSDGGNGQNGWCLFLGTNPPSTKRLTFAINSTYPIDVYGNVYEHNAWNHIVLTRNGNDFNMYSNGEIVSSSTFTTGFPSTTTNMRIGSWNHSTNREFNGKIGTVRAYHQTLTAAEVTQNYNAQSSRFQ